MKGIDEVVLSEIKEIRFSATNVSASEQLDYVIKMSLMSNNYQFFTGENDKKIGYCVWAKVIRESVERLYLNGMNPIFGHEWSEGHITCLMDVCFLQDHALDCKKQLKQFLRDQKIVTYRYEKKVNLWIRKNNRYSSTPKFLKGDTPLTKTVRS
jgi:hemolysin-activating ACP:hemolysin acyltransferase